MVIIAPIGGYTSIGKSMTAVKVDNEVILIDMGLHVERYANYTQEEEIMKPDADELMHEGAIPDITLIDDWKEKVVGIVPSHAHLDHVGAIPHLAHQFNVPIFGTPFTIEVIQSLFDNERKERKNELKKIMPNSQQQIGSITVEWLNITHSTPQSSAIIVHTKQGAIVYLCDFKLDNTPVLGEATNVKRLKEIGEQGVLAVIMDSTNAESPERTPSEAVAKEMLQDLLSSIRDTEGIIITTFSSHLARLKTLLDIGQQLNRKVLFLGRSMARYITAGEKAGVINFTSRAEVHAYRSKIARVLKRVEEEGEEKYLLVVSGHQGEPQSTLSKIANKILEYKLDPKDTVIFSCTVIPTETNKRNRELLEQRLQRMGVQVYKDVHQSGHAAAEDVKDMIRWLKPKHIIPAHGEEPMRKAVEQLVHEVSPDTKVHILNEGERIEL